MLEFKLHSGDPGPTLNLEASLGDGSNLVLIGPSGAGKTSVLRCLAGLMRTAGRISLNGEIWLDDGRFVEPEFRRAGYVFQDYALFSQMSAWRNVAYGIRGPRANRREQAERLLDRFGMADRADARPAQLSGGERQRVALARALASDPKLLLLDEPLSALDPQTRASARRELSAVLTESGIPTILVTHEFTEAATLGDQIAVLDRGRIIQQGTATELAASPNSGLVADLCGASVLSGTARSGDEGLTLIDLPGGTTLASTDSAVGEVALSVFPWEVSIAGPEQPPSGSALNHLIGEVVSVTEFGNRARIALLTPEPFAAEVTSASIHRMGIKPGDRVSATWKATSTRLAPR